MDLYAEAPPGRCPHAAHGLGQAPPAQRGQVVLVVDRAQDLPQRGDRPGEPAAPLAESLDGFWSAGLSPARLRALSAPAGPVTPDLLLRMFPPPAVPVRGQDLAEVLTPAYHRLAADDAGPQPGEIG